MLLTIQGSCDGLCARQILLVRPNIIVLRCQMGHQPRVVLLTILCLSAARLQQKVVFIHLHLDELAALPRQGTARVQILRRPLLLLKLL